jgi:hypothetical protein
VCSTKGITNDMLTSMLFTLYIRKENEFNVRKEVKEVIFCNFRGVIFWMN